MGRDAHPFSEGRQKLPGRQLLDKNWLGSGRAVQDGMSL